MWHVCPDRVASLAHRALWLGLLVVLVTLGVTTDREHGSSLAGGPALFAAATQQFDRGRLDTLAVGSLLVAARTLGDSNFEKTVVILFDYSEEGAAGLIVNRRSRVPVERVLPDFPVPSGPDVMVFAGGPVSPAGLRVLLRTPTRRIDAMSVLKDVYLLTSPAALDDAVAMGAGPDRLRVYAGYAGWSRGQLEREIRRGDWHVFAGQSAIVFDPNPDAVWNGQIRRAETLAL